MVQAPPGWPGVDPNCAVPPPPEQPPPGPDCGQPVCINPPTDCINPDCCGPIAWLNGEWLYWRTRDPHIPIPLVTSGATTLVDEGNVEYRRWQNGGRLDWGVWFSRDRVLGVDFTGFGLENAARQFNYTSNAAGAPPLAVVGLPVTAPALAAGGVAVDSISRLWGGEAAFVSNVWGPLTLLAGFRYLREEDSFGIASSNTALPAAVLPGVTTYITDSFSTRNSFYGGELGARFVYSCGSFWIGAQAKASYGETHQVAVASGTTTLAAPGIFPVTTPVGNLTALPFPPYGLALSRNTDGFVPEGQVKIGYQLGRYVSISGGYDFLYWNRVQRASDLFGNGPGAPLTPTERTYWAQGITAGLEFEY
jgi:hypothetical protein